MSTAAPAQTAVTPYQKRVTTLRGVLESSQQAMAAIAPTGWDVVRAARIALSEVKKNPKLLECDPYSIVKSVSLANQLGLEVGNGLGQFHLVPFRDKRRGMICQHIIGYKGLIELALRHDLVSGMDFGAIYSHDHFMHRAGTDPVLEHTRWLPMGQTKHEDRGGFVGVYALAHMKDGPIIFDIMDLGEVNSIRKRSRARDDGPWKTDYEAMAIKTVVRRMCNRKLPKSTGLSIALSSEVVDDAAIEVIDRSAILADDFAIPDDSDRPAEIVKIDKPKTVSVDSPVGFGKHADKTWLEVARIDREWLKRYVIDSDKRTEPEKKAARIAIQAAEVAPKKQQPSATIDDESERQGLLDSINEMQAMVGIGDDALRQIAESQIGDDVLQSAKHLTDDLFWAEASIDSLKATLINLREEMDRQA